jgi:hypothetical protein
MKEKESRLCFFALIFLFLCNLLVSIKDLAELFSSSQKQMLLYYFPQNANDFWEGFKLFIQFILYCLFFEKVKV